MKCLIPPFPRRGPVLWIARVLGLAIVFGMVALPIAADWLLGLSYYHQGKYRRAVEVLLAEVRENRQDALILRILGLSYYHLRDYDQAEIHLKSALELKPDFEAELGLARVQAGRGNLDTALQSLDKGQAFIQTDRHRFQYHFSRGSILLRQGHPDLALGEFRRAEPFAGKQPAFFAQMGGLEYSLGRIPEALAALERSLELDRGQPEVLVSLGEVCLRLSATEASTAKADHFDRAVALAGEALVLSPDSVTAHHLAGRGHLGLREFPNAERHFRKVIALDRRHPGIFYSLGQALIGLHRYPEGSVVLEEAVEEDPGNPDIHYALGFCREKTGYYRQALDSYRRAGQLRPDPEFKAAEERLGKRLDSAR